MTLPWDEFRARMWDAQWKYLDRLASRIDRQYERLGKLKRRNDRDKRHQHTKSKHTMKYGKRNSK